MTGPVAWIRFCGDGCVEGPILDSVIEEVQRKSGAWTPLYAAPQPSPAIDLEQFREAAEVYRLNGECKLIVCSSGPEADKQSAIAQIAHADRLLALIDGRAQPFNGELRPDDLAAESWPPKAGFKLGLPRGIKLTHKPTGTVVTCDTERSQHANREKALQTLAAKLQPTKGEGEKR